MARMLLALAAAAAILAAPFRGLRAGSSVEPRTRGSRRARAPGRRALRCRGKARLDRREDRPRRRKGRGRRAAQQRFEAAYADAGGRMEALYARHRLDTAVAEADIALGATARPRCAAPTADRDRLAARRADRPAAREPGAAPGVSRAKARVRARHRGQGALRRDGRGDPSALERIQIRHSRRASRRRISLRPTPRSRGSAAAGARMPKR